MDIRVIVAIWTLLGMIPLSILVFCIFFFLRRAHPEEGLVLLVPLLFVTGLVAACAWIIGERLTAATYARRVGRACVRCGYDMSGAAADSGHEPSCPECGTQRARQAPYRSLWHTLPMRARRVVTTLMIIAILAAVVIALLLGGFKPG